MCREIYDYIEGEGVKVSDDLLLKLRTIKFRERALEKMIPQMMDKALSLHAENEKLRMEVTGEISKKYDLPSSPEWAVNKEGEVVFNERVPAGEKVS